MQDESEGRGAGFATVTNKLFRASPIPVLALRSEDALSSGCVAAALDVDPWQEHNEALNLRVLHEASGCARMLGAKLAVVHACTLWGEQLMRSRGHATDEEIHEQRKHEEKERLHRLENT